MAGRGWVPLCGQVNNIVYYAERSHNPSQPVYTITVESSALQCWQTQASVLPSNFLRRGVARNPAPSQRRPRHTGTLVVLSGQAPRCSSSSKTAVQPSSAAMVIAR